MEQEQAIQVISQADVLNAVNRAEIDMQVATAKQYPRHLPTVLNQIQTYATMDVETASDCFYALYRKNADGSDQVIEGLSVRMAEIIAGAWGNLRIATRIIGNDGKTITAQAVCHDLETNVAISTEVKRSILTKKGYTFSQDMQVVTGNAAAAIAFRNAVLKVIPKAVTKKVISEVQKVAQGQAMDLERQRQTLIQYFAKFNVTEQMIFDLFEIKLRDEIDKEKVMILKGLYNAIKEGTTSVQEAFLKPVEERKLAIEAKKKFEETKGKAAAAMKKQAAKKDEAPANVDTETGEIKTDTQEQK
ncbi:MAG: hypothetical protein IJ200_12815 [Prevotella sp.]|nr:hypothetical protein [Prevotella sp.]